MKCAKELRKTMENNNKHHNTNNSIIIYETQEPILFFQLIDGQLEKRWRSWMPRHIEIRSDGTLIYRQTKGTIATRILDIKKVRLTYIRMDLSGGSGSSSSSSSSSSVGGTAPLLDDNVGLHVECYEDKLPTAFKCVLPSYEVELFCNAIRQVSTDQHNVDEFLTQRNQHMKELDIVYKFKNNNKVDRDGVDEHDIERQTKHPHHHHPHQQSSSISSLLFSSSSSSSSSGGDSDVDATRQHNIMLMRQHQSVMRRSIAAAIDQHTYRTRIEKIIARRGAFKNLPVAFTNDLVHGSWWYVIGSAFGVVFPIMIILGNHNPHVKAFKYDDDLLHEFAFDATWILMIVSGIFFTLGSGAFLRAVNDPPMKPFFTQSYHFGTDELLGSWCFVAACLPFVPYAIIYLIAEPTNIIYYCMLGAAIFSVLGSFIFLINCYPSDVDRAAYILPFIKCLNCYSNCCCSDRFMEKHLSNDWLAGTWVIYWVTAFATVCTFIVFIESLTSHLPLRIFVDGCT